MADMKKYLDLVGLKAYDTKIKAYADQSEADALKAAKDYTDGKIGDYATEIGTAYTTVAKAIAGEKAARETADGTLSDLTVKVTKTVDGEEKEVTASNLVEAINAVAANASGATGDTEDLTTTAKGTLVAAINELDSDIGDISSIGSNATAGANKAVAGSASAAVAIDALADYVDALDATPKSDDEVPVNVEVDQVDGKVTDVKVGVDQATVTFTDTSDDGTVAATLVVTTGDEAKLVDGADISNVVKYVDAHTKEAVNALDATAGIASVKDNVVTIKAGLTETDGKIANDANADIVLKEVAYTGAAADVSITDADNVITATTVEGALTEIAKDIDSIQAGNEVTMVKAESTGSSILASYTFYQGTGDAKKSIGTIDLAKDYLVKSGSLQTCDTADSPVAGLKVGDKYIDLVLNTKADGTGTANADSHVYIPVNDLFDSYTSGSAATDSVVVTVDNSKNEITAAITDATIARAKIDTDFEADIKNLEATHASDTDGYLTVAEEITNAINLLDETVTKADKGVQVVVAEVDGKLVPDSSSVTVTAATVAYTKKNGDTAANLSVTANGGNVLTSESIAAIKSYTDAKIAEVNSAVDNLDLSGDAATSATVAGVTVKVEQADGQISAPVVTVADNSVTVTAASGDTAPSISSATTTNVVKGDAINAVADYAKKYTDYEISTLDATVEQAAGDTAVVIKEADGEKAAVSTTMNLSADGVHAKVIEEDGKLTGVTVEINTITSDEIAALFA